MTGSCLYLAFISGSYTLMFAFFCKSVVLRGKEKKD
jgi:hypothetical protein